ncbi:hypothetical protein [Paenibacillus illinoisensis]|uniref:hypothetical protein n=1 Tax=Paenibacillus illinoisensis TaxID=59845 RepID=UPI00301DF63E
MRELPKVNGLYDAVQTVIKSNIRDGYPPNYFRREVSNMSTSQELIDFCTALIKKKDTLQEMFFAIEKYKNLLTIEDFITVHGTEWGFTEEIVRTAAERVILFDSAANRTRYA